MRFRLSTMLLALALLCAVLGWGVTEWQRRVSSKNEYIIASEFSRFNAYNDVYRSMDGNQGNAVFEEMRRKLLLNTVKSIQYMVALPTPNNRQILRDDYKLQLTHVAHEALTLLGIDSADEFYDAIIDNGELTLLKWDADHPDKQVIVQVLDSETKRFKPEFRDFLDSVLEYDDGLPN